MKGIGKEILRFILIVMSILSITMLDDIVFAESGNQDLPTVSVEDDNKQAEDSDKTTLELPISSNEEEKAKSENNQVFDESEPFTITSLKEVDSYSMDMENVRIPIENFELIGRYEDGKPSSCNLSFPEEMTAISGGLLETEAPASVHNQNGEVHSYSSAHIDNVPVYYVGNLTIHNGEGVENYIFYTTDTKIDDKTVYVILRPEEKITLVYTHGNYHTISYQFKNEKGEILEEDKENGWTYNKIFKKNRPMFIEDGGSISENITIPRGYKAKVEVSDSNGKNLLSNPHILGEMMSYQNYPGYNNKIVLKDNSPKYVKLTDDFSASDIKDNITVTVTYEKVDKFTFNAGLWITTDYAKGRIRVKDSTGNYVSPSQDNSILETGNHSFQWEFSGITAKTPEAGSPFYTWELDQLEINSEAILIPMTSLIRPGEVVEETTVLSTGTVVKVSVQSLQRENGSPTENARDGERRYTITIENCYEDLTVSGGNMVSHVHQELAIHKFKGILSGQYWAFKKPGGGLKEETKWWGLYQDSLIDRHTDKNHLDRFLYSDPIRLKRAEGYMFPDITLTSKLGEVLQINDKVHSYFSGQPFFEFLMRKDGMDPNIRGSDEDYQIVPYSKWYPSSDGYLYFRGTEALKKYMYEKPEHGVILVDIVANSIKGQLNYKKGADPDGNNAPKAENITMLPQSQTGGTAGYNIETNPNFMISNQIPIDETGKYTFAYWEIVKTEKTPDGKGKLTEETLKDNDGNPFCFSKGEEINMMAEDLGEWGNRYYYNNKGRAVLTLRAVWRLRQVDDPIPYIVEYKIPNTLEESRSGDEWMVVEEHQHLVNKGATLVSDLWQDKNKTLSPVIQEVLKGRNDYNFDYTMKNSIKWVIYEPKTTKRIDSVDEINNIAYIYLVPQPKLTLSKTVEGKLGDKTKQFMFTIEAKDGEGNLLNGTYSYIGDLLPDISGVTEPEGNSVTFENGIASLKLSHGQSVTFSNLPGGCRYTVTENDKEGYTTTYNGEEKDSIEGTLESDTVISVVNTQGEVPGTGIFDHVGSFGALLGIGATAVLLMLLLGVWRIRRRA